MKWKIFWV